MTVALLGREQQWVPTDNQARGWGLSRGAAGGCWWEDGSVVFRGVATGGLTLTRTALMYLMGY